MSDVCQIRISKEHEEQIVVKASGKSRKLLGAHVTVKGRQTSNPSHYIRMNLALLFNACCNSIHQNCMLSIVFHFQMKPHDIFILSYALLWTPIFILSQHCKIETHNEFVIQWCGILDNMHNILLWVTMYDPFASNLSIEKNWNQLNYPWIFILPYNSNTMLNLPFVNPNSVSYTGYNR